MANENRVGGTLFVKREGRQVRVKGNWTIGYGTPKREAVVGADGVHGYTEKPTAPYFEGEITDQSDLDLVDLFNTTDATITAQLSNGKVEVLRNGWYAGDATVQTEEGNVACRFEGKSMEHIK